MTFINTPCPSCFRPNNFEVTEVTEESATIAWEPGKDEGEWILYVDGEYVDNTTDQSYTFDGFEANTAHTLTIYSLCGEGDTSSANTFAFRTACGSATCDITVEVSGSAFSSYGAKVNVSQNGDLLATVGSTTSLEVCGSAPIDFDYVQGTYTWYSGTVRIYDGGQQKVLEGQYSYSGNIGTMEVPCPSCLPPANVTYDTATIAEDEITLTWVPRSDATQFAVYMNGELVDDMVTDTFYTFNNLSTNTKYTLGVQAICTAEDSSSVVSIDVRTLCGEMTFPYIVNWEDIDYNGAWPSCWTRILNYNTDPSVNNQANHTSGGTYGMYLATGGNANMFASDAVSLSGDKIYVTFWARLNNATMYAGVMTDLEDTSTFIPVLTVEGGNSNTWTEYEFNTSDLDASEQYYVAWLIKGGSSYGQTGAIDDIMIDEYTGCDRPDETNVTVTGPYTATLEWNSIGAANSYNVYYAEKNDINDESVQMVNTYDNSIELDGLKPNTTYYAWVRTVCGSQQAGVKAFPVFSTQLSCAAIQNATVVDVTYTAARVSWTYSNTGNEPTGVSVALINKLEDDTTYMTIPAEEGTDYLFRNLESGTPYTAIFSTVCPNPFGSNDTASSVSVNFQTSSCSEMDATTTEAYIPTFANYGNTISQAIYTKEQMLPINTFSGIAVKLNNSINDTRTLDVYVGTTDKSSFSSSSDWVPFDTLTKVASDVEFTLNGGGWLSIIFDEPYTWDGNSNLVFGFNDHKNGWSSPTTWAAIAGSQQGIYAYRDYTPYSTSDLPNGTVIDNVPALQLIADCEAPSCYAPMLSLGDVDSTSVDFSWFKIGDESTFMVKYRKNSEDGYTVDGSTADTVYSLSGLTSNTRYVVAVGSVCGDDTLWSTLNFRTNCGPMSIPYSDTFEEDEINDAPACWILGMPFAYSSSITFPRVEAQGNNSSKALRFYGYGPAVASTDMIPLGGDEINFSFDARRANGNNFEVGLMTDPYDTSTFIVIDTIESTSYQNYEYYSSEMTGLSATTNYYLAFRYSGGQDGSADVDNVFIRKDNGCHRPTDLVATADSNDVYTVTVEWKAGGSIDDYVINYRPVNSANWQEQAVSGVTTYTFDDLTAATVYSFRVGTVCGEDDTLWTATTEVATGCVPVTLPYLEIFYSLDGNLPVCWGADDFNYIKYNNWPATSGDGELMAGNYSGGHYAILPEFDAPLSKLEISFKAKLGNVSTGAGIMMGVYNTQLDTVEWLDTLRDEAQSREAFVTFTYNFTKYYGDGDRIAIGISAYNPGSDWGMAIDNVNVIELNSCPPPTNITVNDNKYPHIADDIYLTWNCDTEAGEEVSFDIYFDTITSTVDPDSVDADLYYNVSTTSFQVPMGALEAGAKYRFFVRTNCGWGTSNWYPVQGGVGTNEVWFPSTNGQTDTVKGCNFIVYDNGGPVAGYLHNVNSNVVLIPSEVGKELQINYIAYQWGTDAHTFTVYDGVGTSGAILFQNNESASNATVADTIADTNITSTEGAMTIVFTCGYYAANGFEMAIHCVEGASCHRPADLAATRVMNDEADLIWSGNAEKYIIYYTADGETQSVTTTTSDTTYTLTGLTAATTYSVQVCGICGGDTSKISVATSFTTICDPTVITVEEPFIEDFEGSYPVDCFTYINGNNDAQNALVHTSPAKSGSKSFRFSGMGVQDDYNQYIITPMISSEEVMTVSYYAKTNVGTAPLRLGYSTTGYALDDFQWNSAATVGADDWVLYTATIPANTKFVALNMNATAAVNYLFVDSLAISINQDQNVCLAPSITNTTVTTNSITVDFSAEGTVEVDINTGTTFSSTSPATATGTSYTFNGLAAGTTYTIGLRTNCGDGNVSDWVTKTLATDETPCEAPTELTIDEVSYNSAQISWNTESGSAWEIMVSSAAGDKTINATSSPVVVNDLEVATSYTVRIRTICSDTKQSAWSDAVPFATLSCNTPTNASATEITMTSAKLDWVSDASKWELRINGEIFGNEISAKPYVLQNLNKETAYTVEVRAICKEGIYSDWSAPATFTTAGCEAPTDLAVSSITNTSAVLNWSSSASEWEIDVNGEIKKVSAVPYTLTGLEKNTAYSVKVRSICDENTTSAWSDSKGFTTTNVGIDDVDAYANINLYPNPASSSVTINLNEVNGQATVTLVDLNGRTHGTYTANGSELTIDLSDIARGTYFVRITGENLSVVRKLLVR